MKVYSLQFTGHDVLGALDHIFWIYLELRSLKNKTNAFSGQLNCADF
jgi:hypothetical protein